MIDIDKMSDWSIQTYLRNERDLLVQSHYSRVEISRDFGRKFTDAEWEEFCDFACNSFDKVKENMMDAIMDCWDEKDNGLLHIKIKMVERFFQTF